MHRILLATALLALIPSCASSTSAKEETNASSAVVAGGDEQQAPVAGADPSATVEGCSLPPRHQGFIEALLAMWLDLGPSLLGRPVGPPPRMVFVSSTCSYDAGQGITEGDGAITFGDVTLPVAGRKHAGTVLLPNGKTEAVSIFSYASVHDQEPYFVLSLMDLWAKHPRAGAMPNAADFILGVALHELAHTEQLRAAQKVFERLSTVEPGLDDKLNDSLIESRYASDAAAVAQFREEVDLLWAAAIEPDDAKAEAGARKAVELIKTRRAAWFTGDDAWLLDAEAVFLNMEGVGEWVRLSTLLRAEEREPNALLAEHEPQYQGFSDIKAMTRAERVASIRKQTSREWSQEEGLALLLLIDRFVPGWQAKIIADPLGDPVAVLAAM